MSLVAVLNRMFFALCLFLLFLLLGECGLWRLLEAGAVGLRYTGRDEVWIDEISVTVEQNSLTPAGPPF